MLFLLFEMGLELSLDRLKVGCSHQMGVVIMLASTSKPVNVPRIDLILPGA